LDLVKTATNPAIAAIAASSLAGVTLDPTLPAVGDLTVMAATDEALFTGLMRAEPLRAVRDVSIGTRRLDGRTYAVMAQPLVDFSGRLIGLTVIAREEMGSDGRRLTTELWVMALVGGIVAFVAFLVLARLRRQEA
ncbi:MAG: chemotaxis protein, partial [Hyphomicrobiales bacterium]